MRKIKAIWKELDISTRLGIVGGAFYLFLYLWIDFIAVVVNLVR